jgi:hypothetical protein
MPSFSTKNQILFSESFKKINCAPTKQIKSIIFAKVVKGRGKENSAKKKQNKK